jgi:cysteine desulfurase
LEKTGFDVTYLVPEVNGTLSLDKLHAAMRHDTILVSIMQVNNETGVIQNIDAIAQLTASCGILFHVDAAQSIGKVMIDMRQTPVDLLSMCAHKVYGPKGIGALYLRKKPRVRVLPLIHGGGHEQGMRSGTLATHQIVGMGEALFIAEQDGHGDTERIRQLRDRFLQGLQPISQLRLNSDLAHTVPHILNLRFEGSLAETLLAELPHIATSTASACVGKGTEGSYVLRAMGLSDAEAKSSVRFSFGRFTTEADVDEAVRSLCKLYLG